MSKRLTKEWKHLADINHMVDSNFFTLEQCLPMNWTLILHISPETETVYHSYGIRIRLLFKQEYPFLPPKIIFETPVYHPLIRESTVCGQMFGLHWGPTRNVLWILRELYTFIKEEGHYNTRESSSDFFGTHINKHKCCIANNFMTSILYGEYPVMEAIVQRSRCRNNAALTKPLQRNNKWCRHSSNYNFEIEKTSVLDFTDAYHNEICRRKKTNGIIRGIFQKYNLPDVHEQMVIRFGSSIFGNKEQFWSYYQFHKTSLKHSSDILVQTNDNQIHQIPGSSMIFIFPNLNDIEDDSVIFLEPVSSVEMSKILEFLKLPMPGPLRKFQPDQQQIMTWPLHFLKSETMSSLSSLLKAANFLGIEHLVTLICLKIALSVHPTQNPGRK